MRPRFDLLLTGLLTLATTAAGAGPADAALAKAGCVACHAPDKKLIGPSFKDIAARYKGQKDAPAQLVDKVRKGGKGSWGPIPMPPSGDDKISEVDLKLALDWVLSQ